MPQLTNIRDAARLAFDIAVLFIGSVSPDAVSTLPATGFDKLEPGLQQELETRLIEIRDRTGDHAYDDHESTADLTRPDGELHYSHAFNRLFAIVGGSLVGRGVVAPDR